MAGSTDLPEMLRALTVSRREGRFAFCHVEGFTGLGDGVEALIAEDEGTTVVCRVEVARRRGWPVEFEAAWLTLDVHSALEGVGLTAAVATALAEAGIACNVIAAFYHDHLLVPAERADDAVAVLEALRDRS